jgi:predicted ATPase/DNA-binding SARP family transcriptional activator
MPPRKRTPPEPATNETASTPAGVPEPATVSYQQKYTRCNKPTCRSCAEGPGHGPYWYAFWWEGGRTRTRYLGKTLPEGALVAEETPTLAAVVAAIANQPPAAAPEPVPAPSPTLRAITLGRFAVLIDETPLPETAWPRRKAILLFKLLLTMPNRRLTREQVLERLWPEEDEEAASAGLRGATHGIRRALALSVGNGALQTQGGVIALAGKAVLQLDADEFAASADQALAGNDIAACRATLASYTGDYLPDDLYEDWADSRRRELATLRIAVLLHLARLCGEGGDLAEARTALSAALAADPAHEDAAIRQMTLLAAIGEQGEALRVFERLEAALDEQLSVRPSREAVALAGRLRNRGKPQAARRPAVTATPRHSNLPAALSTFVGREGAREAVQSALRSARLVTLLGAGGSGKTRLALHVAESMVEEYPDGVWLCELAGLAPSVNTVGDQNGPDPVARALAGALDLLEDPACSLDTTIGAFLEPRRMLLVLDNCEHVLDSAAPLISFLLTTCGEMSVLATSREALGLPGEVVWTVPPLSLPEHGLPYSATELEEYDAIRLFVERARGRKPGFALNEATAPGILEVCRRLDGIPLAIELAAARLAFLSLENLAARLEDRFRLLVGGSRIALPRQQTLRAAMDWSYSLLGENERTLLLRLTVFAGGWTLEAAEGVCADSGLPEDLILDTLGGLVAKSLVTGHSDAEWARYGMLETVRQYGQLKLTESPGQVAPRARHLAWFSQHCEELIAGWNASDQATLLRHFDADLDNIRAALAWGLGPDGDAVDALNLTSALSRYWTTRGLVSEGRRWTAQALEAAPHAPAPLRATALNRCAILARTQGDNSAAATLWEAALMLFRELGDGAGVARVVGNLGMMYYDNEDDPRALELLTESLALVRELGTLQDVARTSLNLGVVYTRQKRYVEAEATFAEAEAIYQATDNQAGLGDTLLHIAHLARDQEHLDRAAQLYAASLRIFLDLGDRPRVAPALEGLAHVLLRRYTKGTREQLLLEFGTRLFACAAALRESTGVPIPTVSQLVYQPDLHQLHALLGTEAFEEAWTLGWDTPVLSLLEHFAPSLREGRGSSQGVGEDDAVSLMLIPMTGSNSTA